MEGRCEEQESMGRAATSVERDTGAVQPGAGLSLPRRCAALQGLAAVHWNALALPKSTKAWTEEVKGNEADGTTWRRHTAECGRVTARVGSWASA